MKSTTCADAKIFPRSIKGQALLRLGGRKGQWEEVVKGSPGVLGGEAGTAPWEEVTWSDRCQLPTSS